MKKVLLIYGGRSTEHEISCKSAESIINNIDNNKYQLHTIFITQNNEWFYNNKKIDNIIEFIKDYDIVFPLTHGNNGEDGKLQGMLDLFKIKYVGSKCGTSYICMDKIRTKQILNYYNIPQVPYQIYEKDKKLIIPYPVIVKPANGGSSIGIQLANNKKEFNEAIRNALKYDDKIVIEKFIKARELECAILEDNKLIISDIGEIISANTYYDYEAKYQNSNSKVIVSSDINNKIKKQIRQLAKEIFKIMDLKGYARIDFFYDEDLNKIYLNEINTIPGFTEISMFPKLIENEGISYKDLISKLIENEIKR